MLRAALLYRCLCVLLLAGAELISFLPVTQVPAPPRFLRQRLTSAHLQRKQRHPTPPGPITVTAATTLDLHLSHVGPP